MLLTDGYQTFINFPAVPGLEGVIFKEKEIQPPGVDSNGEVDTTTMRNNRWRTKQPKHLVSATDMAMKMQYDPIFYQTIVQALIGRNTIINVGFPDTSVVQVWGWVDNFVPDSLKEGDFPLADCKVHCSNQDFDGVESPPEYFAPGVVVLAGRSTFAFIPPQTIAG